MNILTRILKILAYVGTILVVLLLLLFLFTQTQFFKDRIRILLIATLSHETNGTVHIGTIKGNFFNELSVDSLGISYNNQPLLTSGSVTLRYELLPLLENKLKIRYFIIEQPRVYLVRSQEGEWNFNKVFVPPKDTTATEMSWSGVIDDIEFKNGSISILDSFSLLSPQHEVGQTSAFEYHNFTAKDINIQLSGTFKKNNCFLKLIHTSFYTSQPEFEMTHCKGEFTVNEHGISASNVVFQTTRSYLELDAKIRGVNIFHPLALFDLQHDSVQLQLKANNIDFRELRTLLPRVDFLDGSAFIDMRLGGAFGDIDIQSLRVKTYQSSLNLSGNIKNLHEPEKLHLNILVGESRIHPGDLTRLLPPYHIPSFDSAGQATLYAQFSGEPLNFDSKIIVRGNFGEFSATGTMNLQQALSHYDLHLTTKNLDIGKLFAEAPRTSLSLHGNVKGNGFSLDSLRSSAEIISDSSQLRNLPIDHAQLTVEAVPHNVNAKISFQAQAMQADGSVHGDFIRTDIPTFTSELSLSNVDLATLFNDNRFKSNITLRGTINGSGNTVDNFNTDSKITLFPSVFRGHPLERQEIQLLLDQQQQNTKRLVLRSSIADIDLAGRFDLDYAATLFPRQMINLVNTVRDHAFPPDSGKKITLPRTLTSHTTSQKAMNFDYAAHIKDLGPIATLFSSTPFDARASLSGRMTTRNDMLGFTCNGMIDEFYVGSSENGGIVNNCSVVIALDSLTMTHPLEHLSCRTNLHFNSGMINGVHFDSSSFSLHYAQARGLLSMNGIVDSLYSIAISGVTSIQPNMYVFDVDTLRVSSGSYSWHNNDDIQFRLNSEETRMMHAEMVRANETISLSGGIHYSGNVDITAEVRNFDLAGLGAWFPGTDLSVAGHAFSGNANAALRFSGALSNPIFDLALTGDHVQYRQTHIGTVRGSITYKDMLADINITTLPLLQDTLPSLVVRGVLPVNLAFSNIEKRFPDITQDLNIVSQGFNLALLDPLLAEFDNLTGTLTCNVTVGGTPSTPEFGGAISLRDAQFLFTPNNIPYLLNATLQPSGEHIILQDCLMRNVSSTEPGGEIHLTGSVSIKNYKISSFDVTTTGQLLIMSNATKKAGASLYGPLFTETDSDGLKLSGTLDRPFLSGKLFVREANLVFPPTNSITTSTQLALNHYIIDDTSKIKGDTTVIHISKFFSGNGFQETEPRQQEKSQAISLIDRLRYNLTIETQGTAAIKMIFTPATNEELYAELEGHASVINSQGTTNVYGDITVLPRSYYNFFHRFDANGTIKFVGPWDNPELKVIAKYEGRNTGSLVLDPSKEATTSSLETTTPLSDQRVIVLLDITGTRYEPKLSMSMKVQRPGTTGDENLVDWSGDVQSDAISFILTGKFRDDLSTGEQQNIASAVGSTAGSGLTSNYLSGILTDVLRREFPFIRTAEFSYAGGNPNVRVTGDVLHGRFQVGGNIQNEEGRSKFDPNVSYQVSIGDITNNRSLRNLFIELQRREANFNDDKKTYETRIYYRFSF